MAVNGLSQAELQFIKYAVGINQLSVGAEPYIGIVRLFEQVVQPFMNSGVLAICSTVVASAGVGNPPAPVQLTLDSAAGLAVFDTVNVDVDAYREQATVVSVSGNNIVVQLAKAHGAVGAYPVEQQGGTALVRQFSKYIRYADNLIEQFGPRAGIASADEVKFFGGAHGRGHEMSGFQTLAQMRTHFRRELCLLIFGVGSIDELLGGGAGASIGVY